MKENKLHRLSRSEIVKALPAACSDELLAVEFIEQRRWGNSPACLHCGSVSVYKMVDAKTGLRNKRFRWRCHDCHGQYTVRQGTVFEESRIPLRHWCFAFWAMAASRKGVSALQIKRQTGISYKSALFLLHRIRFAMKPTPEKKMSGIIEADEVCIGPRRPRPGTGIYHKRGRGTPKIPVFGLVERGGNVHRRVIAGVTAANLKGTIRELVDRSSTIYTDDFNLYRGIGPHFDGGHQAVKHAQGEYARGDVNTNSIESSFALIKRAIIGTFHNVSREHLGLYLGQFDFLWNTRQMNDGERTVAAIQAAEGKRLTYRQPVERALKPPQDGNQLPMWPL